MALSGRDPAVHAFRPDLEGLRGVAIVLVLVFHMGLPASGGGFVGVDVFFVLSGFLITGLLLDERERRGSISLSAFYARRARRILPAALVVIVGTLVVSLAVVAPLDQPSVALDGAASALSIGNIRFALGETNYFAADIPPSPFLHYWSLGVEEQFYLVWPALLILATRLARPRLGATIVLSIVVVASFAISWLLTEPAAQWAFYSLPARAWQLGLGGLLASLAGWRLGDGRLPAGIADWWQRFGGPLTAAIGWLGLAAIVATLLLVDPTTPYPGIVALAPTVGAAAIILAGGRSRSIAGLLSFRPLRYLGLISFSLYLVHWPILVLPARGLALGEELPIETRLLLGGASILVAAACQRWIERPFHRGPRLVRPPRPTLAFAGAALGVVVALSFSLAGLASMGSVDGGGDGDGIALSSEEPFDSPPPEGPSISASATPGSSPGTSSSDEPSVAPSPSSGPIRLSRDVRPPLRQARDDWELDNGGCFAQHLDIQPPNCVYGDRSSPVTIALVGDSHALQWSRALERIAVRHGWRLLSFTKLSCRFTDVRMFSLILKREYTECARWREVVIDRLQSIKPDLTVVAAAQALKPIIAADDDPAHQGAGMARLLNRIPGPKAIIVDTPQLKYDVPACLSRHTADIRACETPRDVAFGWRHLILETTAAAASRNTTVVDMTDVLCPGDPCPVVMNNYIMYRDDQHLTATFSASLSWKLEAALPDFAGPA